MCWGLNNRGQIGIGNTLNALSPEWVDLGSGTNVTEVVNGFRHTCAILENGSLMCWGENLDGQMGNGQQYQTQTTPLWVDLGAGRTAASIDADSQNTCAIADNGSLYCWGDNTNGVLNDDPSQLSRQTTPRWIDLGGHAASEVSVGSMNVCSILDNGSLYCWGDDSYGQLARGSVTLTDSWVPLHVDFGAGVTVAQIDLGSQHVCAIVDNGSLYCWGRNSNGALGNGSAGFSQSTGTPSWVDLGTGRTAVAVSAGGFHTCAIVDNGSLYCWGMNSGGQAGIGSTVSDITTPQWVNLGVGRTAIAVSAGGQHTCAILDNGEMKCWGQDYNGALGNGVGTSSYTIPQTVPGGFTWNTSTGSNSGGSSSNYALTPSVEGADLLIGQAMNDITFQYNASGTSGSGSGTSSTSSFVYANNKIAGGQVHNCAITDNGDLKCWGNDDVGRLGNGGTNTNLDAPPTTAIDLGTGRTAVSVSAGREFTCAILDNGDLKCWGYDAYGQLGDGGGILDNGSLLPLQPLTNHYTSEPSLTPVDLGAGRKAVTVSAGDKHVCAILDNGDLKCWGHDDDGQLGDGDVSASDWIKKVTAPSSTPVDLGAGRTAVAVSAGFEHTCAILDNGDLKCWGSDSFGALGDGGSNTDLDAPPATAIDLGTGRTAVAVSAGMYRTCAILDNGDLKCWGYGYNGLLGLGSSTSLSAPSSTPIDLGTDRTAVAVSMADNAVCAILDNGDVKCWGSNTDGMVGIGVNQNYWYSTPQGPLDFGTGRTAVAISGGYTGFCAILDNNDTMCWGSDDYGQVGDGGSNTDRRSPVSVSGSNTWDSSTEFTQGSNWGLTSVSGANCSISPSLPAGLSIDSGTCTISGTPTAESSNTTYTVTAIISNVTYQTTVWLSSLTYLLTPNVEGAKLSVDVPMSNITFQYDASASSGSSGTWLASDIDTNADGARSVYVADMDGDGDLDIVSSSDDDDTIAWYENDGAANPSWMATDIATSADGARSVFVADMDGDGDLDIVSASREDDTIAWYENDGAADPSWAAADIDTNADGAFGVRCRHGRRRGPRHRFGICRRRHHCMVRERRRSKPFLGGG